MSRDGVVLLAERRIREQIRLSTSFVMLSVQAAAIVLAGTLWIEVPFLAVAALTVVDGTRTARRLDQLDREQGPDDSTEDGPTPRVSAPLVGGQPVTPVDGEDTP